MNSIDVLQEMVEKFAEKNGYEVDYETIDKLRDVCNGQVEVEDDLDYEENEIRTIKRLLNLLLNGDYNLTSYNTEVNPAEPHVRKHRESTITIKITGIEK